MKTKTFFKSVLTYVLFWIFYLLYIYVFKIRNKTRIIGKENMPKIKKGLVTYENHESFIDPLPIRALRMRFWDMLFHQNRIPFDIPDFKNFFGKRIKAFLFKHLRNIPIKRDSEDEKVREELVEKCCDVLKRYNLNVFFEGGRTINEIRLCTSGFAKIILKSIEEKLDVVFLPMYTEGIKNIMPREVGMNYLKISFGHEVLIIIGKPVDFSDIVQMDVAMERKIYLIKKRVRESVLALKP